MRAYFRRRLRHAEQDIEDLVQETLIALHTRRESYDPSRPFTPWVFGMARRKWIDLLRRGRDVVALGDLGEEPAGDALEPALTARMDIETLLARLPAKQARAIRDTKIEGLSIAEAAKRRGLTPADVKTSVHRGLKQLRYKIFCEGCNLSLPGVEVTKASLANNFLETFP